MFTKKIKFKDFDGKECEREYQFNLTQSELVQMESSKVGGLAEYGKRIIASENVPEVMQLFKELILLSYGEKSADGQRFIKEDPIRGKLADEFKQSAAFDALYMEFIQNPDKGAEFFNNVIPADLKEEIDKMDNGHAYPPSIAKA
ncbi:MAG: hypothetical protein J6U54_03390 [Clostridiales bacterium]|nr:hypothetical protein [Clostridiales bacterium]